MIAKWDSDQRLNSLYAQKYAVENTCLCLMKICHVFSGCVGQEVASTLGMQLLVKCTCQSRQFTENVNEF